MVMNANFIIQKPKNKPWIVILGYDHCQQFALQFISFDHVGTATLKSRASISQLTCSLKLSGVNMIWLHSHM